MSGMLKTVQAKDLPDVDVLMVVAEATSDGRAFANSGDLAAAYPSIPAKVIYAKMRALVLRGYLDGCDGGPSCMCGGDWSLTPIGRELLP